MAKRNTSNATDTVKKTRGPRKGPPCVSGYRFTVNWIAEHDFPNMDVNSVSESQIAALVADQFDKLPIEVAIDVVKARKKNGISETASEASDDTGDDSEESSSEAT